ncbi:MAG: hypothetical protein R3Y50_07990 [Rikenellaceae bacterium]
MTLENTIRSVIKVLRSCNNKTQFEGTLPWGVTSIAKCATNQKLGKIDHQGKRQERILPPRVTSCKMCDGAGYVAGHVCTQCNGTGRVVVTSEVITYIKPYEFKLQ